MEQETLIAKENAQKYREQVSQMSGIDVSQIQSASKSGIKSLAAETSQLK